MKTLKETTNDFILQVKKALDSACWDFEACDPRANYSDVEKACNYLNSQKFSFYRVKDALEDVWSDLVYNIRHDKVRENKAAYAAGMIADVLAHERVSRYRARGYRFDGLDSKKWWINETVSFKIK